MAAGRSIVADRGLSAEPAWAVQRRVIVADLQKAFGRHPDDKIHAIASFTDNNQARRPVEANSGWARVHCAVGAGQKTNEMDWDCVKERIAPPALRTVCRDIESLLRSAPI